MDLLRLRSIATLPADNSPRLARNGSSAPRRRVAGFLAGEPSAGFSETRPVRTTAVLYLVPGRLKAFCAAPAAIPVGALLSRCSASRWRRWHLTAAAFEMLRVSRRRQLAVPECAGGHLRRRCVKVLRCLCRQGAARATPRGVHCLPRRSQRSVRQRRGPSACTSPQPIRPTSTSRYPR